MIEEVSPSNNTLSMKVIATAHTHACICMRNIILLVDLPRACFIPVVTSNDFNGDAYHDDSAYQYAWLGGAWWYYYKNAGESKMLKTGNTLTEDLVLEVRTCVLR